MLALAPPEQGAQGQGQAERLPARGRVRVVAALVNLGTPGGSDW